MTNELVRWSALALGSVWAGAAWSSPLPVTPVDSWTFFRNDSGAALFGANLNTFGLGPADDESPNTLSGAGVVGTWGGDIALQIDEVARVSGSVLWAGTGDGSPGLRFGLVNSDGNLLDGSPGYVVFLDNETDNTFDRTTTASTVGPVFSPLLAQNLNATVLDEQGTWQDVAISPFTIEVERTGSDSVEIRFLMSSESGAPVNINAVATHSAANGGAAARTFNFNAVGMQFSAAGSNAPDSAVFFDINIVVFVSGDYNFDGTVDAADYVLWRKTPTNFGGYPAGYHSWRANFGVTSGSGSAYSMNTAVPEPSSAVPLILTAAIAIRRGLRRARPGVRTSVARDLGL